MRKTPSKVSKSPLGKSNTTSRSIPKTISSSGVSQQASSLYYCHYKNASYMGGIKSFKKEGKGILLHDNGVCALTSYHNDLPHGHNIYIDRQSLLSVNFYKNKIKQLVYRIQGFLIHLRYNDDKEIDGQALLLNYVTKSITYAVFRKGTMIQKQQENDLRVINRVFELNDVEFIIGRQHAKVINYDFQKIPGIQFSKQGNKLIIGFQKQGFINGLGMMVIYRGSQGGYDPQRQRNQDQFQLRLIERGYYMNTQLNGMGDKTFKNGNLYRGQFRNGIFEGYGVLINQQKNNWVSGVFRDGNLAELLDYSSEGQNKKYDKIIENLHQRKSNWINYEINLLDTNAFVEQISRIITTTPNKNVKTLEERKHEVLRRIQEKFLTENQTGIDFDQTVKEFTRKISGSGQRYINNFTPQNSSSRKRQENEKRQEIANGHGFSFKLTPPKLSQRSSSRLGKNQSSRLSSSKRLDQFSKKKLLYAPGNLNKRDPSSSRKRPPNQLIVKSHQFNRTFTQGNIQDQSQGYSNQKAFPYSSERERSSQSQLDSKRLVGTQKLFLKQEESDRKKSPQFAYSKVDTMRQEMRRNSGIVKY